MNYNLPLKSFIPVPVVFYPFPVHFLRIVGPSHSDKRISRVLNSLQENEYTTIDDLLNSTVEDLINMRNFGEKGLKILISLLEGITQKPELILDTEFLDQSLREEVERIKQVPPVRKQLLELGIEV